jgi:nitrogen regulatory protein PII-like uncharacterized protein
MVWGDVKGYVGRGNNTFKTNDVKDLIIKGFKTITPEKWTNFCIHVENKIEPQYWKSDTGKAVHYNGSLLYLQSDKISIGPY